MSRFDDELTQTHNNTGSILEDEFNLTELSDEKKYTIEQIKTMRNELLESVGSNQPDPDDILYVNIQRANDLLDVVYKNIVNDDDSSPRLFEVAAQLVNAVTAAATSVQNSGFGIMKHEYNMKMADIKEREVAVKAAIASNKSPTGGAGLSDGKVVVMSREELLNMIESENKEVEVPSVEEQNK
jgi:hypothetical protein